MRTSIYLVMIILLAVDVLALGVAPSHQEIIFEPNTVKEIDLVIINNEHRDLNLLIVARNELVSYVEVPTDIIRVRYDESIKELKYKINMPQKLQPGTRIADLLVVESEDLSDFQEQNIIKTSIGVMHQLRVIVPYPDQYLQGTFYLPQIEVHKPTEITIGLVNLGNSDIKNIKGNIIISDANGNGIAYLNTTQTSLKSKEKGKIIGVWDTMVSPGRYKIQGIVNYEGKILLIEKEIDIGDPLVEISGLRTYPFKLGTIARLDIILKNKWNQVISGVFSQVKIRDSEQKIIHEYITGVTDIAADESAELPMYWDTRNAQEGLYTVDVRANYMGRFSERIFETEVKENEIIVKESQITGQAVSSTNPGVIGGFIGLLAFAILLIVGRKYIRLPSKKPVEISPDQRNFLRTFIKKKLKEGYSRESIKQNLMSKGWNKSVIESEMLNVEDESDK